MNSEYEIEHEPELFEARVNVERRRRLRVVFTVMPALLGLIVAIMVWGLSDEYFRFALGVTKSVAILFSVSMLAIAGLSAVMTYLQTGFSRNDSRELELELLRRSQWVARQHDIESDALAIEELRAEVMALREQAKIGMSARSILGEEEYRRLVNGLTAGLSEDAAGSVLSRIRTDVAAAYERESKDQAAVEYLQESRSRLLNELDALGRRGNLNLALGAVTTVVGIILLGMSVFSELTAGNGTLSLLSHFLPRLTLVVLIELFAYFFLSLYKASLSEIKYFQNELTNIEAKQVALRAAIHSNLQDTVSEILSSLAATERNHVLTKDQTTVELEKVRIEKDGRSEFAKYAMEFFQKRA